MGAVLSATLVWQFVDFLRELTNWRTQRSAVVTQATAWIAGVVGVVLASHASVAAGWVVPGFNVTIGSLDGGSQLLVGLLFASLASTGVDVKQALDGNDSAAKPPLLGPPTPPAV